MLKMQPITNSQNFFNNPCPRMVNIDNNRNMFGSLDLLPIVMSPFLQDAYFGLTYIDRSRNNNDHGFIFFSHISQIFFPYFSFS